MNDGATTLTQPYLYFLTHLQEGLCAYWVEEMECESLLTKLTVSLLFSATFFIS